MFRKEYVLTKVLPDKSPDPRKIDSILTVRILQMPMQYFRFLHAALRYNHLEKALHRLQDHENQLNYTTTQTK